MSAVDSVDFDQSCLTLVSKLKILPQFLNQSQPVQVSGTINLNKGTFWFLCSFKFYFTGKVKQTKSGQGGSGSPGFITSLPTNFTLFNGATLDWGLAFFGRALAGVPVNAKGSRTNRVEPGLERPESAARIGNLVIFTQHLIPV